MLIVTQNYKYPSRNLTYLFQKNFVDMYRPEVVIKLFRRLRLVDMKNYDFVEVYSDFSLDHREGRWDRGCSFRDS